MKLINSELHFHIIDKKLDRLTLLMGIVLACVIIPQLKIFLGA